MNQELREKLEDMKEELEGILDEEDEEPRFLTPKHSKFRMGLAAVRTMIRAGLIDVFDVDDEIWAESRDGDAIHCWIVIGKNIDGENSLTLWCVDFAADRRFDERRSDFPYGRNLWRDCTMRAWLNGLGMTTILKPEDVEAISPVKKITLASDKFGGDAIETEDKLWLLSACEAGFAPDKDWNEAEGKAYPYFGKDEDRQIGDWWWTRSASRGSASHVWRVASSGYAYSYSTAASAFRPAPACVIR